MTILLLLVPLSLALGAIGLGAFLWTLRAGQYDDLEGGGVRVLLSAWDDRPAAPVPPGPPGPPGPPAGTGAASP